MKESKDTVTVTTEEGKRRTVLKGELAQQLLNVKHRFKPEEILKLSQEMAMAHQHKANAEATLKELQSEIKARINKFEAIIGLNSAKITNGYEIREENCWCEMHPKEGYKDVYFASSGEFIDRRDMDSDDYHRNLPMEVEKVKPENPEKAEPEQANPEDKEVTIQP